LRYGEVNKVTKGDGSDKDKLLAEIEEYVLEEDPGRFLAQRSLYLHETPMIEFLKDGKIVLRDYQGFYSSNNFKGYCRNVHEYGDVARVLMQENLEKGQPASLYGLYLRAIPHILEQKLLNVSWSSTFIGWVYMQTARLLRIPMELPFDYDQRDEYFSEILKLARILVNDPDKSANLVGIKDMDFTLRLRGEVLKSFGRAFRVDPYRSINLFCFRLGFSQLLSKDFANSLNALGISKFWRNLLQYRGYIDSASNVNVEVEESGLARLPVNRQPIKDINIIIAALMLSLKWDPVNDVDKIKSVIDGWPKDSEIKSKHFFEEEITVTKGSVDIRNVILYMNLMRSGEREFLKYDMTNKQN
jgi:hypothetical protein